MPSGDRMSLGSTRLIHAICLQQGGHSVHHTCPLACTAATLCMPSGCHERYCTPRWLFVGSRSTARVRALGGSVLWSSTCRAASGEAARQRFPSAAAQH